MFTFKWVLYMDFPVEEGQLKNDITFDTFTATKLSKTSGGPGALLCLSLPFAKNRD